MPSTAPRSPRVGATMARPAFARIIIPITTVRLCSIPTGTISKRCVTPPAEQVPRNIDLPAPLSLQDGAKHAAGLPGSARSGRQPRADFTEMPIDPPEHPPIKPGQPTEPPVESPPG